MSQPIVVIGAGGFGREVIDVIEAMNAERPPQWNLLGVVDDSLSALNRERLHDRSVSYLGSSEEYFRSPAAPVAYTVGIGAPSVRRRLADRLDASGHQAATLIHPTVTMGARVTVEAGTVLCAGVRIGTNVTIGRHVHINPNATVGHDTIIADFVSLNPLSSISGDCVLEQQVLVGVGGIVLNGLHVGEGATVGGAACVVRDVLPNTTVVGVPAKPLSLRPG